MEVALVLLEGGNIVESVIEAKNIFSRLVNEITDLINEEVIITNEKGIIVASTDRSRIDAFHEGAYLAMRDQKKMVMTKEKCETLQGVRKGIVLPIIVKGNAVGVLGITGDPSKVEPFGMIVQRVAELFIKESIDQMSREERVRRLELFMFDWIYKNLSEEQLFERSKFFDIDIRKYRQVVILQLPVTTESISYRDLVHLGQIWDEQRSALFIRWGQDKIIIVDKEYEQKMLASKLSFFLKSTISVLGSNVAVGIGQPNNFLNLKESLIQAERACIISKTKGEIVFEEQLQFEIIQYGLDINTKLKFIQRTIYPIMQDETLMETLESWLRNDKSIPKTSEELYVHRNTLYYRLEKIEQISNLNLNNMEHLSLIYIGVRFLDEIRKVNPSSLKYLGKC